MLVDPPTFGTGVVWRDEWTGSSLGGLLARLGPAGPDGQVPAIQVGAPSLSRYATDGLPPMRAVASVPNFLGCGHADGMVVPAPWLSLPPIPVSLHGLAGTIGAIVALVVLAAAGLAVRSAQRTPVREWLRG